MVSAKSQEKVRTKCANVIVCRVLVNEVRGYDGGSIRTLDVCPG